MKLRNPKSRFDLNIKKTDRVLEIGGGHNPHPRADVVVDKHTDDNTHRDGSLKILHHQTFIEADGENLPFGDNEFDYVICCHVLEQVENPTKFLKELSRVASKGYIEIPSLTGEFLIPKNSHRWVTLELENKLILTEKVNIGMDKQKHDFGDLFLCYFNNQSIAFKILMITHPDLFTVRYEWENKVDFIIKPQDEKTLDYFNKPWDYEMLKRQFPKKSVWKEGISFISAFLQIAQTYLDSAIKNRKQKTIFQIGM